MDKRQKYIKRCFEIALLGRGQTSPNPTVGAVLVYNDKIIGEGFHEKYGKAHAEVNAINSVPDHLKKHIPDSTLYVSLEPCCVFGKTPPCTNLILDHKIKKVVVATRDLSPEVAGQGLEILRQNGVTVIEGILEKEGKEIAAGRHALVTQNRPYIILKYAQSLDGKIGTVGKQTWLSNQFSTSLSHKWRSESDAILVGPKTVVVDNPSLTTRNYFGKSPKRIILDPQNNLKSNHKVFSIDQNFIVIRQGAKDISKDTIHWKIDYTTENWLKEVLKGLAELGMATLMVEGGAKTLQLFLDKGLWDEARVFSTEKVIGDGVPAPKMSVQPDKSFQILKDRLHYFFNR
jgi:diaminohydroxyphosphoribosylaminopyrimidine deaminase/5-amino-6-(5-phosphoribosylamino)uracil reductase